MSPDMSTARALLTCSLLCLTALGGCRKSSPLDDALVIDDSRDDAQVFAPEGEDLALVILLHGYGSRASRQDFYFGLSRRAEELGFVLVAPNGTRDDDNERFWAATEECCDFDDHGVDDVAYIRETISRARQRYDIDEGRVYVMGHSNGGFMAYTMACEMADEITGVLVLAGSTHEDASLCSPAQPVRVMHLHGTEDDSIEYSDGEVLEEPIPGAEEVMQRWAELNGCDGGMSEGSPTSLTRGKGDETVRIDWTGCPDDGEVSLWRMDGVGHIPAFESGWIEPLLEEMLAVDRTP